MSHLADALERGYRVLGLEEASGGDDVFRHLVVGRIIEPSSKLARCGCWRRPGCVGGRYLRTARHRHRRDSEPAGLRRCPATLHSRIHYRPGTRLTIRPAKHADRRFCTHEDPSVAADSALQSTRFGAPWLERERSAEPPPVTDAGWPNL
jgi:hypothetical protein